jgi:DNA excision repair protein ERCC-3
MSEGIIDRFNRLKEIMHEANKLFSDLSNEILQLKEAQASDLQAIAEQLGYLKVNQQLFKNFFNKPYVILPRKEGEWYLITPRFIDLQLGWLYQQTESYNVFIVNRYIDWLYKLPPEVKQELGFKEPPFKPIIEGDFLLCKPEETDLAWQRYKRHLTRREAPGKIRIKRRSHFWLVCELIKDGILPFKPKPVDPEDLLERYPRFELKDFQKEAWAHFTRFGNIGVYWPPGVGKMFFAIYALTRIKGKKLVVVPTVTLVEEWTRKIKALTPLNPWEYEVICYASAHKVMNREYVLTVFDEHQHLPANTYARLALIKTKYRIGTTATPWREDGRIDLIFALTGFPLGLSWKEFLKMKVIAKPYIELIIVPNITQKFSILNELIRKHQEKTMIFCDSINLGKRISSKFGIPFVYGATARRLQIIERNPVTVVSRVGDEGIDITDLKTIIEFDFLFGSRRQEAQRMGRLLHSRFKGEHYILMTSQEFERYKKRLYSLYERGFQIKITRRD